MPEQQPPDPSAAIALEDNLKEFDNLDVGGGFDNVLKGIEDTVKEDDPPAAEPETPAKEEPVAEEPAKEEEPAKATPEEEEVEDFDFPDDLTGETTEDEPGEEPEVEEEVPKGLSKKGQVDWKAQAAAKKELRTQLKAIQQEKEAVATELEDLRKQAADLPELRKQAEYVEEAEKKLAILDVKSSKEYENTIQAPLDAIEEQAVAIAKANEVGTDKMFDAMAEADPVERRKLLKAVTEDMDGVDSAEIFQMAKDTQTLLAKRHEILSKASEAAKETQQNAKLAEIAASEKSKAEYEAASSRVMKELKKRVPFEEQTEGETEAGVYEVLNKKMQDTDFENLTPDRKAFAVASGLLAPRLLKQISEAKKTIAKLEGRLTRKNSAKPSLGTDAPAPATGDDFGGDIEAAVAAAFGQSQPIPLAQVLKNI